MCLLLNMNLRFEENSLIDLKTICLNCIIINFDKLMEAHRIGSISSRYFEFLQRKFSKELILEVTESCFIQHLDFLLNRHLKEIDIVTSGYNSAALDKIIKRLKEIGETITSLKLTGYGCDERQLLDLTSGFLPNVKSLDLSETNLSQEVLVNIRSHCKFLEELDVSGCEITDKCLESFCSSNKDNNNTNFVTNTLRHLNISDTEITALGIASALKNLPNLSILSHDYLIDAIYNLHDENLKSNPSAINTYNLEELVITYIDAFPDDALEICASACPHIKKLKISMVSQRQLDSISKFCELKELSLRVSNQSLDFSTLLEQRGCYLETLGLNKCKISSELLLKFCSKLKHLSFTYSNFLPLDKENPCRPTYTLQSLKRISFDGLKFSVKENVESAHLILASSPILEELHLSRTYGLTDELLKLCNKLPFIEKLTYLDVSFSDITSNACKSIILAFPNLEVFLVTGCNFTDADFTEIQSLRPSLAISKDLDFYDETDSEVDFDEYDNYYSNSSDYSNYSDYSNSSDYEYEDFDFIDPQIEDIYNMLWM